MVVFDRLEISSDGTQLFIDAHVNTSEYFDAVYFDTLTIMTADQVEESGTSPEVPSSKYIYKKTYGDGVKSDSLAITADILDEALLNGAQTNPDTSEPVATEECEKKNFRGQMLFVYIKCKGTPNPCVPCPYNNETTVGVTYDLKSVYQAVMNYTKSLASDCNIPADFIDLILRKTALDSALKTEHFLPAIKFWKMLFGEDGQAFGNTTTRKCNCHG